MRTIIYPEWLLDGTGGPARVGQALAFAEGRIEDPDGKLYALCTTTCLLFPMA